MINRLMNWVDFEPIRNYNWLMEYNWQQDDWPNFRYTLDDDIHETLLLIAKKTGFISGKHSNLPEKIQNEIVVNLMVEEAIKTSKIEGDYINRIDVRSSIKNKLGLYQAHVKIHDKKAEGISELMLDVKNTFKKSLTESKLYDWHIMLSRSINPNLLIGRWRVDEEPMQIVSGNYGRQFVHFEAPPAYLLPKEMKRFIQWFNNTAPGKKQAIHFAPVRSAIAHLYFESIHPFDDGNGRIGRAIAEKALSQGFGHPLLLSLSYSIDANKKKYYAALNEGSRSNEITAWIKYFVNLILQAQKDAENQINYIINKAKFYDSFSNKLNERQLKVIKQIMKNGVEGFEGGMSAKKYMKITGVSKATATRDLQDLVTMHALKQIGSGRNVRYELNFS